MPRIMIKGGIWKNTEVSLKGKLTRQGGRALFRVTLPHTMRQSCTCMYATELGFVFVHRMRF